MCEEVKVIIVIITAIFSLLGSFFGAFLARRTQYQKWLLENRSEVFTKFLELMDQAREEASNILFEESSDEFSSAIRITEKYIKPINYAKVVRLYLPKAEREKFQQLANQVWALHSDKELGDSRLATMGKKMDEIQMIFESSLLN